MASHQWIATLRLLGYDSDLTVVLANTPRRVVAFITCRLVHQAELLVCFSTTSAERGRRPVLRETLGGARDWFSENDLEWLMKKGQDLPITEFDCGQVGIMTCYDGWYPEPARVLSLKGAEIIAWIDGRGGSAEDCIMKSIMSQSHVGMIAANQAYGSGTMIGDWPARILEQCHNKNSIESYSHSPSEMN